VKCSESSIVKQRPEGKKQVEKRVRGVSGCYCEHVGSSLHPVPNYVLRISISVETGCLSGLYVHLGSSERVHADWERVREVAVCVCVCVCECSISRF